LLSLDISWNEFGEEFMNVHANLIQQGSVTSLTSLKVNQVR
jgi:hypothetical protein